MKELIDITHAIMEDFELDIQNELVAPLKKEGFIFKGISALESDDDNYNTQVGCYILLFLKENLEAKSVRLPKLVADGNCEVHSWYKGFVLHIIITMPY